MEDLRAICFACGEWHKCDYMDQCKDARWEGVSKCCDILLYKAMGPCILSEEIEYRKNSEKKKKGEKK